MLVCDVIYIYMCACVCVLFVMYVHIYVGTCLCTYTREARKYYVSCLIALGFIFSMIEFLIGPGGRLLSGNFQGSSCLYIQSTGVPYSDFSVFSGI